MRKVKEQVDPKYRIRDHPVSKWINHGTEYVDIETGEQITKTEFTRNYIQHGRTEKLARLNENRTVGELWYIKRGRKRPQLELF